MAAALANSSTRRWGSTSTAVPTRHRRVAAAMNAHDVMDSRYGVSAGQVGRPSRLNG